MSGCSGRRGVPVTLAAALALAVVFTAPRPAPAHAIVLESVPAHDARLPASPERIVLRFNGRIEKGLSRVTLVPGGGRQETLTVAGAGVQGAGAPDRIVIPLRPLPPGTYVLRYKVLAADGHVTEGALRFTVTGPR